MLSLIELITGSAEWLSSWRLFVGLAATAAIAVAVIGLLPVGVIQWAVGMPIAILGAFLSFWWQIRADEAA